MKSKISVVLSAQEVADIKKTIGDISPKMPFLVSLTKKEKRALIKLGPKSADFVSDAAGAAKNFPDILPRTLDAEEFQKDSSLFAALTDIAMVLDSMQEKVNDTLAIVGNDAMTKGLKVYAYVQTAASKEPGLKSVADKLKVRFKKTPQAKKDEAAKKAASAKKDDSPQKDD